MEIKTQKDGERFFRDLRIFKALDSGRQISGVAAEFCVSENTARSAYNRIKILQMTVRP